MVVVCRKRTLDLVWNTRAQGLMWTAAIVMTHPFSKRALQMRFIQRYQIVQTLSPNRPNQTLAKSIGEGGQLHRMVILPILRSKSSILIIH
jgi:hypothetical protein